MTKPIYRAAAEISTPATTGLLFFGQDVYLFIIGLTVLFLFLRLQRGVSLQLNL